MSLENTGVNDIVTEIEQLLKDPNCLLFWLRNST